MSDIAKDPWLEEYMVGIYAFEDGVEFDESKSDAWQSGWAMAREDNEVGQRIADELE